MAYQLLEDCQEPTKEYDGEWYIEEHWDIDKDQLEQKVVWHLEDNGIRVDIGSRIDEQIEYHCREFMENGLDDMIDEFKQGLVDQQDIERTNRWLSRTTTGLHYN
jgi:predicted naringenin-chalcone synthase